MTNNNKTNPNFFENNTWQHRTKILMEDLTISYGKKGVFKTGEDAAEAYVEHLAIFKTKINLLKERQSISFSFREYMAEIIINAFPNNVA